MVPLRDILNRPLFTSAQVAAGHQSLDRLVKWVHIGEIPNLAEFLKGGELILATGAALASPVAQRQFIQGLIDAKATALVLELGQYFPAAPADIVKVANQHQFPVIVFPDRVRFLDISYDVNTLIISQHHRVLEDLEALALKSRQALLNTEGLSSLVRALHDVIQTPVAFYRRSDPSEPIVVGSWSALNAAPTGICLNPSLESQHGLHYVRQTVMVFGQPMGDLVIQWDHTAMDERLYLACDRTAAALAQDIIRSDALERSRHNEETVMLSTLLSSTESPSAVVKRFDSRFSLGRTHQFRVLVANHDAASRAIGRCPRDLKILHLEESDRSVVVLIGRTSLLDPISALVSESKTLNHMGFSAIHDSSIDLRAALLEAQDALTIALYALNPGNSAPTYDQLGLYRWILSTTPSDLLRLLVRPELQRLLDLPDPLQSTLLSTLEALVAHPDSKSMAAQSLGIHRQTLYGRIHQIETYLGPDFLNAPRRRVIEAAIVTWRYLNRL